MKQTTPVGQLITTLREKRNVSQKRLAKLISVNQRTISGYENGTVTVSINRLVEIFKALKVDNHTVLVELLEQRVDYRRIHVSDNLRFQLPTL